VDAGEWLKTDVVEPHGVAIKALAEHVGIRADTLMRLQTTYDLAQARSHESDIKVERFIRAA